MNKVKATHAVMRGGFFYGTFSREQHRAYRYARLEGFPIAKVTVFHEVCKHY